MKTHTIFLCLLLASCGIKIRTINGNPYDERTGYLVAGRSNAVSYNNGLWQIDSVETGTVENHKEEVAITVPDVPVPEMRTIYAHSWIFHRPGQVEIVSSRPPNPQLKLFPSTIGDSLSFDNLRFLRYRLMTDSSSFITVRKPVDGYYCHFDSVGMVINQNNRFSKNDLDRIWKTKPKKIVIDSVYYTYENEEYTVKADTTISLYYPKTDEYAVIEGQFSQSSYHVNSLLAITRFPGQMQRLSLSDEAHPEIIEFSDTRDKYPFINLGEIPGINLITVKDEHGNLILERLIDGDNQRIEDFQDLREYQELHVTIKGKNSWSILIRYIEPAE